VNKEECEQLEKSHLLVDMATTTTANDIDGGGDGSLNNNPVEPIIDPSTPTDTDGQQTNTDPSVSDTPSVPTDNSQCDASCLSSSSSSNSSSNSSYDKRQRNNSFDSIDEDFENLLSKSPLKCMYLPKNKTEATELWDAIFTSVSPTSVVSGGASSLSGNANDVDGGGDGSLNNNPVEPTIDPSTPTDTDGQQTNTGPSVSDTPSVPTDNSQCDASCLSSSSSSNSSSNSSYDKQQQQHDVTNAAKMPTATVTPTTSSSNSTAVDVTTQATTSAPQPSTVGNSFVKQYYHLLAQSPETLHRFYNDDSKFTHGTGSCEEDAISGQKNINTKIMNMGFKGARVDLASGSVDCQTSLNGGVLVMVAGIITLMAQPITKKAFTQTFFLVVQPNGYFILNDAFRYTETHFHLSSSSTKSTTTNVTVTTDKAVDACLSPENQQASVGFAVTPKAIAASPPLPPVQKQMTMLPMFNPANIAAALVARRVSLLTRRAYVTNPLASQRPMYFDPAAISAMFAIRRVSSLLAGRPVPSQSPYPQHTGYRPMARRIYPDELCHTEEMV
jgi:hypothetical protein